jgi:muramidase (phage lysozyme)
MPGKTPTKKKAANIRPPSMSPEVARVDKTKITDSSNLVDNAALMSVLKTHFMGSEVENKNEDRSKQPLWMEKHPIFLNEQNRREAENNAIWMEEAEERGREEKIARDKLLTFQLNDTRKIRATTGLPMNPSVDLVSGKYDPTIIQSIIDSARKHGVDPNTALAIALQETKFGNTDLNLGHTLGEFAKGGNGADNLTKALKAKLQLATKLGKKTEEEQLQAYNGYGKIKPSTEEWYHGFKMKKIYGVDVPEEGIDMSQNPLYGKQIIDLRENVLKQNPEIQKMIDTDPKAMAKGGIVKAPKIKRKKLVTGGAVDLDLMTGGQKRRYESYNNPDQAATYAQSLVEGGPVQKIDPIRVNQVTTASGANPSIVNPTLKTTPSTPAASSSGISASSVGSYAALANGVINSIPQDKASQEAHNSTPGIATSDAIFDAIGMTGPVGMVIDTVRDLVYMAADPIKAEAEKKNQSGRVEDPEAAVNAARVGAFLDPITAGIARLSYKGGLTDLDGSAYIKHLERGSSNKYVSDHSAAFAATEGYSYVAKGGYIKKMNTGGPVTSKGGKVNGAGTGTSDSVKGTLAPGSFVAIAAKQDEAQAIGERYLGWKAKKVAALAGGGGVPVAVSKGEVIFTPEEAAKLTKMGVDLSKLAPEAKGGQKLVNGGFVADDYLKNPYVLSYIKRLIELEADPANPLKGGTKIDKNNDNVPDSSALGSLQFTKGTRKAILEEYGYDAWSDDAEEQKKAGLALIHKRGQLENVSKGHFSEADKILKSEWPSLPGGTQQSKKLKDVMERRQTDVNAIREKEIQQSFAAGNDPEKTKDSISKLRDAKPEKGATYGNRKYKYRYNGSNWERHNESNKTNRWDPVRKGSDTESALNKNYADGYGKDAGLGRFQAIMDQKAKDEGRDIKMMPSSDPSGKGSPKVIVDAEQDFWRKTYGMQDAQAKSEFPALTPPVHKIPPTGVTTPATAKSVAAKAASTSDDEEPQISSANLDSDGNLIIADENARIAAKPPSQVTMADGSDPSAVTVTKSDLKAPNDLPKTTTPAPPSGETNLLEKVGGPAALAAVLQTGIGAYQLWKAGKRPKDKIDGAIMGQLSDALNDKGWDPAVEAAANDRIELNRRADVANINNLAGGDTATALANSVSASNNANRAVVALASQKEGIRMAKNQRADSLATTVAGMKRNIFQDDLTAFNDNQKSAANLMQSGIANYFGAMQNREDQKREDERLAKYGTTGSGKRPVYNQTTGEKINYG